MINEVYNVVQELLNKNGYGLLSPTRFTSFAKSAQLKVLSDTVDAYRKNRRDGGRYDAPDTLNTLEAVLEQFASSEILSRQGPTLIGDYHIMPKDYMRWESASVDNVEIVKLPNRQKAAVNRNYYVRPTEGEPVCFLEGNKLTVYPLTIGVIEKGNVKYACDEVELQYYRYPKTPNWTYSIEGGRPIFRPDKHGYQDFEVPESLFNSLVVNIASMAGVHLKDEDVVQYAMNADQIDFNKKRG